MVSCGTRKRRSGGSIPESLYYNLPGSPLPYSEVQQTYLPIDKDPSVIRPATGPLLGGGSVGQSLDYVLPNYPVPNAEGGVNYLQSENPLVVRPRIGGFMPSVMKGVVNAGMYTVPAAVVVGRRLLSDRKVGKGGGKRSKANWERIRLMGKEELLKYGSPSGANTSAYSSLLESNPEAALYFLKEYKCRKGVPTKKASKSKAKTKKNTLNLIREEAAMTTPIMAPITVAKTPARTMARPTALFAPTPAPAPVTKTVARPTAAFAPVRPTAPPANMPPQMSRKNKLNANRKAARNFLSKYGKPNASHVAHAVTLMRNKRPEAEIIADFQEAKARKRTRKVNTTRKNSSLTSNQRDLIQLAFPSAGI